MARNRADAFFHYARERHAIHIRRRAGQLAPWTADKILRTNRFCCVFREDDKTTQWFRKHVRDPMRDKPEVLLATVVFRMFNRIEVGEAIFCQTELQSKIRGAMPTAFEMFCMDGDVQYLKHAIKNVCGTGPYTTGAYIISSPPGYDKLDGVLKIIDDFNKRRCARPRCGKSDWYCAAEKMLDGTIAHSLEKTWEWLAGFDYLGRFHSYEIVTDLRFTRLLSNPEDCDTWACMGPGARRGLNRIHGRKRRDEDNVDEEGEVRIKRRWGLSISESQALDEMRELLDMSRFPVYWPQRDKYWPRWELREVEHTLCEFDKYERVRLGEGKPRGSFP